MISITDFFVWWYARSPQKLYSFIISTIKHTYHLFSVGYLFRTLFQPWKRDISMPIDASIQEKFAAMVNNLIARIIGFIVRISTIIAGIIILIITTVILFVFLVLWFLVPLITIGSFVYGIWIIVR